MSKYFSRKFILTLMVTILSVVVPVVYTKMGVSDAVLMTVLALLGGVGVAYGFINVKDSQSGDK